MPHSKNRDRAEYVKNNRDRFALYGIRQRDNLKLEMVEAYGGKCQHCSETDPIVLTLDHIHDDSHVEKELYGLNARGGHKNYQRLKAEGWPKDRFQLLCFNCNAKKEHLRRRETMLSRWGQPVAYAEADRREAQAKVGTRAHNTSGFKGVFWDKTRRKWHAQMMYNYKSKFLGCYDNIEDAAKAHRAATIELWGDKVQVLTDEEIARIAAEVLKPVQIVQSAEELGL